jgi:hypothetical protein
MKQYQNWLAQYLICRRDGDHAMAAELAEGLSGSPTKNHLTGKAHGQGRRRISFMPVRWLHSIIDRLTRWHSNPN